MYFQKTIKKAVSFKGVGLHTGKEVEVTLRPAPVDHGIQFIRTDAGKSIPALSYYVVDTTRSTTLGKDGVTIATIEHLMAALWGLGIDNLDIEVNGPEIPILDGSSYPFVKKIKKVGIFELSQLRKVFVVTQPVSVVEGDRYCYILSHRKTKLTCSIEFDHPLIQKQKLSFELDPKNFKEAISKARTFGFLKDVERLKEHGLIQGAALDNAIVLDEKNVLNKEGLYYKDEFVRHKILDTIGDMALFGLPIIGHWVTHKSGHGLHYKLLRKILTSKCGYVLDTSSEFMPSEVQDLRARQELSMLQPISA